MSQAAGKTPKRTEVGYAELVDLPDWGIENLRAKIDTGAKTSALHVVDIEEIAEGEQLRFKVVRSRNKGGRRIECIAPIARRSRVRSSNGIVQTRYVVTTHLRLGEVVKEVEISLTTRGRMIYRMLLGRSALAEDFLINAGRRYVATKPRRKRKTARGKSAAGSKAGKTGKVSKTGRVGKVSKVSKG